MSKVISIFVAFLICSFSHSQNFLNKFSEKKGILFDQGSKINYNVGDDRFSLTINEFYKRGEQSPTHLITDELILEGDVGLTLSKNKSTFYGEGKYSPGFDISGLIGYEFEFEEAGYLYPFFRIGFENSKNQFGILDTSFSAQSYNIQKFTRNLFGMHAGANIAFTEDLMIGISAGYFEIQNWEGDLKEQTLSTNILTGVDTSGNIISFSTSGDAYLGSPINSHNTGSLRFDFFWRCFRFEKIVFPSIGILASAVAHSRMGKTPRYDISIGPTFHIPTNTDKMLKPEILATVLFQWNGLYEGIPYRAIWDEKFSINLVLGVPFSIFKL